MRATRPKASHIYNFDSPLLQLFTDVPDYFRDKIVKVLMFAFDCLYFEGGARRTRGLSVIEVIADYGRCSFPVSVLILIY